MFVGCGLDMIDVFFFFKQKTAYDMRISDWSSDVCSSDLSAGPVEMEPAEGFGEAASVEPDSAEADLAEPDLGEKAMPTAAEDAAPEVADETEMPAEAFAVTEVGSTDAPNAASDDLLAALAELNAGDGAFAEAVRSEQRCGGTGCVRTCRF